MKAGLACMMVLPRMLRKKKLRGNLVLTFATGEETGELGTKHLLTRSLPDRGIQGDWGIVLEPSSLETATSEKGLTWFHITLKGRPAHASAPENGVNAVAKAVEVAKSLEKYNRRISKRSHPLVGRSTCTMTMIWGGVKENLIPESCTIAIDRRFLPGENISEVERDLHATLKRLGRRDPEFGYDFKRTQLYEPAEIPVKSEIAEVLRRNTQEITGKIRKPYGFIASSDVRNFINDAKIPAVTWGPGDLSQAHTFDESVEIKEMIDASKILALTAYDLLS